MNHANLTLEQAPSIFTPLRYFITAPLFLIISGVILLVSGPDLLENRWNLYTLALTHSLALGFISMSIIGAFFQILPVVAGCHIPQSNSTSFIIYCFLVPGIVLLILGFILNTPILYKLSLYMIVLSLSIFIVTVLKSLLQNNSELASAKSLNLSIISFLIAVILATILLAGYAWPDFGLLRQYTHLHIIWAAVGWILISVIGVSYQVIPMFQITSEYPAFIKIFLTRLIFIFLIALTFINLLNNSASLDISSIEIVLTSLLAVSIFVFVFTSIKLVLQRKKRSPDSSLWFINISFFMLALCVISHLSSLYLSTDLSILSGMLFFSGFSIPLIIGMLSKIIPFLIWYHLHKNAGKSFRKSHKIPLMTEIFSPFKSRLLFYVYIASFTSSLIAMFTTAYVFYLASILWILLGTLLFLFISHSIHIYTSFICNISKSTEMA